MAQQSLASNRRPGRCRLAASSPTETSGSCRRSRRRRVDQLGGSTVEGGGRRCLAGLGSGRRRPGPGDRRDYRRAATSATWRLLGFVFFSARPPSRCRARSRPRRWVSSSVATSRVSLQPRDRLLMPDPPVMVDFVAVISTSEQSHPIVAASQSRSAAAVTACVFTRRRVPPLVRVRPTGHGEARCSPRRTSPACRALLPAPRRPEPGPWTRARRVRVAPRSRSARWRRVCCRPRDLVVGEGVNRSGVDATISVAVACRRRWISFRVSACSTGFEVVDVPGVTGGIRQRLCGPGERVLCVIEDVGDLFVLHVEETDEAGHQGLAHVKVDRAERWDTDAIRPDRRRARGRSEPFRILNAVVTTRHRARSRPTRRSRCRICC